MHMLSQRHLFTIPENQHYLNGAYMSPLLRSVEAAGQTGIQAKRNPADIKAADYFTQPEIAKQLFGKLVNCSPEQVAIIPSASYGLSTAVANIPVNNGDHAIIVSDEFPSGFYPIQNWCRENNKELKTIAAPPLRKGRAAEWNQLILDAINSNTAVVLLSSIHWTDGTRFDLEAIGKRCRQHGVFFIIDGTQAVGALPTDIQRIQPDALVCAGYKWLLGPYSIGLAYFSPSCNAGNPIEYSWLNRSNAEDFSRISQYSDTYRAGASRFSVGESGNFVLLPMLIKGMEQVLEWKVDVVQQYSEHLIQPLLKLLEEKELWVESPGYRAGHLFGFGIPPGVSKEVLLAAFQERNIHLSVRGASMRVSTHLYNTAADIQALIDVLNEN